VKEQEGCRQLEHVDRKREEHRSYVKLPRAGKGEIIFFVRGCMHAISIFKILCHVHVDVYLEQKQFKYKWLQVQIELFSRQERSNGQGIHSETPTDTSTVQEQESPKGKGIDQHLTWFHIGRDRLSSSREGDGSGC
jgi:hypothetical protein